jgi:hypothetical protein
MNIYIHIGVHKTASSTIQVGLSNNRGLLAENDWLYPKKGALSRIAHHNVVFQIRNDRRYNPRAGDFEDLISEIKRTKKQNVIVSSEDFSLCNLSEVEFISNQLRSLGPLRVIVYLRRQDEWLNSRWAQLVKNGRYSDDFESSLKQGIVEADFYNRLQPWAEVLGKENIIVRVLERNQLEDHVCIDFLRSCGFQKIKDFIIPENQNVSPSMKTIEVIRYFVGQIKDTKVERRYIDKSVRLIRRYADDHGWNDERPNKISPEIHELIMEQFVDSNRKIAQEYLGRDDLFFEKYKTKPITIYDLSELHGEEILDLLSYVFRKMIVVRNRQDKDRKLGATALKQTYNNVAEGRLLTWVSQWLKDKRS